MAEERITRTYKDAAVLERERLRNEPKGWYLDRVERDGRKIVATFVYAPGGHSASPPIPDLLPLGREHSTRSRTVVLAVLATAIVAVAVGAVVSGKMSGTEEIKVSPPAAVAAPAEPTATAPGPPPDPQHFQGSGSAVIGRSVFEPSAWVLSISYTGTGNFVVWAYGDSGNRELLVNTIGRYTGQRFLAGSYRFDITANASWKIDAEVITGSPAAGVALRGRGDTISGVFAPAASAPAYAFSHDGQRNFAVWLYCDTGRVLAQNRIGLGGETRIVSIPKGSDSCFWDVQADGNWTITAVNR